MTNERKRSVNLVDYDAGNLHSFYYALIKIGYKVNIVKNPKEITDYTLPLVIPGVGHFNKVEELNRYWKEFCLSHVKTNKLVGICVGMQWLCQGSEEAETIPGLNLFKGKVEKLLPGRDSKEKNIKVPHLGWNTLNGLFQNTYAYFAHSYCLKNLDLEPKNVCKTQYGVETFYSLVATENNNVVGIQFHPELSGKSGLDILEWAIQC